MQEITLTVTQFSTLALAASVITRLLDIAAQLRNGRPLPAVPVQLVLAGGALVLAFFWAPLGLPVFPELPAVIGGAQILAFIGSALQWLASLISQALLVVAYAHAIYQATLKDVVFPALRLQVHTFRLGD